MGGRRDLWWKSHMGIRENPALIRHAWAFRKDFCGRCSAFLGWDALGGSRSAVLPENRAQQQGDTVTEEQSLAAEGQREWPSLTELFGGDLLPARHSVPKASLLTPFPQDYMIPKALLSSSDCKSPTASDTKPSLPLASDDWDVRKRKTM